MKAEVATDGLGGRRKVGLADRPRKRTRPFGKEQARADENADWAADKADTDWAEDSRQAIGKTLEGGGRRQAGRRRRGSRPERKS